MSTRKKTTKTQVPADAANKARKAKDAKPTKTKPETPAKATKLSAIDAAVKVLEENGALEYSIVVAATAIAPSRHAPIVAAQQGEPGSAAAAPAWLFPAGAAALVACLLALHLGRPGWAALVAGGAALAMILLGLGDAAFRWGGLGLLYAALPSAALVLLRAGEGGLVAILFLAAVVWSGDVAAYFGGRRIGGPRLWPKVSPKKTISGAVCGLAASVAAGLLVAGLAGAGPLLLAALIAAALGAAGQAGDLLESGLKRRFAVKDSGALIPGHGGVLDRLDALFAAAVAAAFLALAGIGGPLPAIAAAG